MQRTTTTTTSSRQPGGIDMAKFPRRFSDKVRVDPDTGCWLWLAGKTRAGYGSFWWDGQTLYAHRFAWEFLNGLVPDGLELDHFLFPEGCAGPSCANPAHVRPASHRENTLRGDTVAARHLAKTHCPQGHEYTAENTYVRSGSRYCRACRGPSRYRGVRREGRRWEARRVINGKIYRLGMFDTEAEAALAYEKAT